MLLFIVFLLRLPATDAFTFPKLCPISPFGRVPCCPFFNGSQCGNSAGRGSCVLIPTSRTVAEPDVVLDDRDKFPFFYYSHKCQCNGNYSGPHCGECIFNHDGDKCDILKTIERKDIRQLTPTELTQYIADLNYCKKKMDPDYYILISGDRFRRASFQMKNDSYYNVWCYSHYQATKPFLTNGVEQFRINYAHQSSAFLPWHRFYILFLENRMQKCTKNPYWACHYYNWGIDSNCSICNDAYMGSNNAQGVISPLSVFSTWRTICGSHDFDRTYCIMPESPCERSKIRRLAGMVPGVSLPTKTALDFCLTLRNLDTVPYTPASNNSCRNCMEGWVDRYNRQALSTHNQFHVYVGGTMSQVPIACNDPLFFLHHTFIDKYWELWFNKWYPKNTTYPNNMIYPNNQIYGHRPTDCLTPFLHCWTMQQMTVPVWKFGVRYSNYYDPI